MVFPSVEFSLRQRLEEVIAHLPFQAARLPFAASRRQRYEAGIRSTGFGQDNFLAGVGALQQAREVGLGLVYIDRRAHGGFDPT